MNNIDYVKYQGYELAIQKMASPNIRVINLTYDDLKLGSSNIIINSQRDWELILAINDLEPLPHRDAVIGQIEETPIYVNYFPVWLADFFYCGITDLTDYIILESDILNALSFAEPKHPQIKQFITPNGEYVETGDDVNGLFTVRSFHTWSGEKMEDDSNGKYHYV